MSPRTPWLFTLSLLTFSATSTFALAQRRHAAQPPLQAVELPMPSLSLRTEKYTLANGLEVILAEDHNSPSVAVNLWYHVGSKDEAQGRNGFAHLFEHLMFQGSRHIPEDTFFRFLEEAGNSDANGTTDDDRTNYYETLPSHRLELALWLESDRMAYLLEHVAQPVLDSQREVVLNERREDYEDAPYGATFQMLREATFPPEHPYHRLTIGNAEELRAATLRDVHEFFRTWYTPNNATLVLTGDFQASEAKQLVEQYFGPIPSGPTLPARPIPPLPSPTLAQRLRARANVQFPKVYFAWPTPAFMQPGDAAADLLASVLSKGRAARLIRSLVTTQRIAQDVSAAQFSMYLGSQFVLEATASPGHTTDELVRAIEAELTRLRSDGPTAAELRQARTSFVSELFFSLESLSARADRLNLYNQTTGHPDAFAEDLGRYASVTPEEARTLAQRYLAPSAAVILTVEPDATAPVAGVLQ